MTFHCRSWLLLLVLTTIMVVGLGGDSSLGVAGRNDVNLPEKETCTEEGSCEAVEDASCVDDHVKCSDWSSRGECESNAKYMSNFCKKSCGICGMAANFTE